MLFRILKIIAVLAALVLISFAGLYAYVATINGKRADELKFFGQRIKQPIFFAHRGGGGEAPENTIAAFEKASENGIDVLELDIRASRDGELVVIHDSDLERTTNGIGPVGEKTLAELKGLDAGYAYSNDGGKTFPFRGLGVTVPSLREVLEKFPDRGINIEFKDTNPALAQPLCTLISGFGRKETVIVASADSLVLESFRSNCKGVATSASFREAMWFLLLYKIGLSKNFRADMQALQIPENLFGTTIASKDFVQAAHERGLKLHIWTANKKTDIKRLIDAGVDGVMTDRPSLRAEVITR